MKDKNKPNRNTDYDALEGYSEKRSNAPLIAAIIIAAIVVLGAAGFFAYALFLSDNPVISRQAETTVSKAAADTTHAEATTVPITVNQIAELAVMPDLSGLNETDAYSKLNSAGIKFSVSREYSDTVKLNNVIKQTPSAGSQISRADQAVVYISRGREDEIIPFTTSPSKKNKKTDSSKTSEPEKETEPQKSEAELSGDYILPGSNSRYLSESDLAGLGRDTLNLALNEIYARRGRIFSSPEIKTYFESKSWYHGTVSAANFDESRLNSYEKYNISLIYSYQAEHGYR